MIDRDTLGCSGRRGSKNLGELASGDYPAFGTPNRLRDYAF